MENGWFTNSVVKLHLGDVLTASGVELSGGEWTTEDPIRYITKNFVYEGNCSQSGCEIVITRTISGVGQYVLGPYLFSTGWNPDGCYTNDTDLGRGICKQLATQGWEYVDDGY